MAVLEEHEAAVANGYTWKEWLEFDLGTYEGRMARVEGIAFYRMHRIIEMHGEDAISRESDRRSRQH